MEMVLIYVMQFLIGLLASLLALYLMYGAIKYVWLLAAIIGIVFVVVVLCLVGEKIAEDLKGVSG